MHKNDNLGIKIRKLRFGRISYLASAKIRLARLLRTLSNDKDTDMNNLLNNRNKTKKIAAYTIYYAKLYNPFLKGM